jgi:hypothetical protein
MRRFLDSNRSLLLKIAIAAAAISLVSLAASGALASGRQPAAPASGGAARVAKDDVLTLQKKLAACRQEVADDREAIGYAESFLALAKRNRLVAVSAFGGTPIFVTVAAVRDALILRYVTGEITKAQLATKLHQLALQAAATLKKLTALIAEAHDARDADEGRCAKLAEQLNQAQSGGGGGGGGGGTVTFTLQPGLTEVKNTHQSELTIDPAGRKAHFVASSGAIWKSDYSWKVPTTITPGKSIQITIEDKILSIVPDQPLTDYMSAFAPDFAQQIQSHWPDNPDVSKTYTVPIAADQKDSSDIAITIGFISSGVTYHYKK